MVWIKGPRCGVSNCASQFYQILGGHRVCQHGHVQEGLETTGDEDDYNAIGRKVRTPQSQQSQYALASQLNEGTQALRGNAAKIATFELLQIILQHQVRFLQSVRKMPPNFEIVTRDLWSLYLNSKSGQSSAISLTHIVALVYLSTRIVNVPVLLTDLNLWIRSSELPYFQGWRLLDPRVLEMMPPEQKKQLRPMSEPGVFLLHTTAQKMKKDFEAAHPSLNFIKIDDRYVCFRMCKDLMLPPHIYLGAMRLLAIIDRPQIARRGSVALFEEIPAVCMIVVAAKLYYGLDHIKRYVPPENSYNMNVWRDIVRKVWLLQPEPSRADERMVHYWDNEAMDNYISWFQSTILPPKEAKNHLNQRLESMFPLPDALSSCSPYIDQKTLLELSVIAQSTQSEHNGELDASDAEQIVNIDCENGVQSEGRAAPGTLYQSYSARMDVCDELPDQVGVLYSVIAKFMGADEYSIRQYVRLYERWLKRSHEKVFPREKIPHTHRRWKKRKIEN